MTFPSVRAQRLYPSRAAFASAITKKIVQFLARYDTHKDAFACSYVHRSGDPCTDFSYDNLDRLKTAEYGIDDTNEVFTMDKLGNREKVNLRDTNNVDYGVDNLTNRYDSVGDSNLIYDEAGNLKVDRQGYGYAYDYENRIVEINDVNGTAVAEFTYDCLGRRIEKKDLIDANNSRRYYYNNNRQVLAETDAGGTTQPVAAKIVTGNCLRRKQRRGWGGSKKTAFFFTYLANRAFCREFTPWRAIFCSLSRVPDYFLLDERPRIP